MEPGDQHRQSHFPTSCQCLFCIDAPVILGSRDHKDADGDADVDAPPGHHRTDVQQLSRFSPETFRGANFKQRTHDTMRGVRVESGH